MSMKILDPVSLSLFRLENLVKTNTFDRQHQNHFDIKEGNHLLDS